MILFALLVTHAGPSDIETTLYGPYTTYLEAERAQAKLSELLRIYVDVSMEIKPLFAFDSAPAPLIPYQPTWIYPCARPVQPYPLIVRNSGPYALDGEF
jgi:hypothetical protein